MGAGADAVRKFRLGDGHGDVADRGELGSRRDRSARKQLAGSHVPQGDVARRHTSLGRDVGVEPLVEQHVPLDEVGGADLDARRQWTSSRPHGHRVVGAGDHPAAERN